MSSVPRYNFLPGTEIKLHNTRYVLSAVNEDGYEMMGLDDCSITVISFERLVEYLSLPGAKILDASANGDRVKTRLGGFTSAKALKNEEQKALGRFNAAMCQAVDIYVAVRQQSEPAFRPSGRKLDTKEAREFIAKQMSLLLGERVAIKQQRGGEKTKIRSLYEGRTINRYYQIYKNLAPGEFPEDFLVPLIHLRGNRTRRINLRLLDLMTHAWEKIGLDIKGTGESNVMQYLETLIHDENKTRKLNNLEMLPVPSNKTLKSHREKLQTATEYSIAVYGLREAKRRHGRGSTDQRALMIGEVCDQDEQKMSLITVAKERGFWHSLSDDTKANLEAADTYIRKRWHILVMLDVASRMPLAWVITENPNAQATLALLRMATRDKTREMKRYGCTQPPASACGILNLRNDNGTGLRNETVISAAMGMGTTSTSTRTSHPTDRSQSERLYGTGESQFMKVMPGYTGRRPGDIPGYDAIKDGVVDVETLYAMITRYFIDEYPFQRHYGVGLFGRRPWDVYQEINKTRGQVRPLDPDTRRIHLGWEVKTTPSDEGVRVFEGIWFNSDELQRVREEIYFEGKARVFVDPDNLEAATVLLPGHPDPIVVHLQTTVFADLTIGEYLQLVAEYRRENPQVTEIYDDHLMETRKRRFNEVSAIGVEHNLARSYTTFEECSALAKAVYSGARHARTERLPYTIAPDALSAPCSAEDLDRIRKANSVPDGTTDHQEADVVSRDQDQPTASQTALPDEGFAPALPVDPKAKPEGVPKKLRRPDNLKELK